MHFFDVIADVFECLCGDHWSFFDAFNEYFHAAFEHVALVVVDGAAFGVEDGLFDAHAEFAYFFVDFSKEFAAFRVLHDCGDSTEREFCRDAIAESVRKL